MTNYEYTILENGRLKGSKGIEVEINKMANDGWEPVNISCNNPYQQHPTFICLLRREEVVSKTL